MDPWLVVTNTASIVTIVPFLVVIVSWLVSLTTRPKIRISELAHISAG